MISYRALILYESYVDDYEAGEGAHYTSWNVELTGITLQGLLSQVIGYVYAPDVDALEYNADASKLSWSYLGDYDNAEASTAEIELWKKGERELYAVSCDILISRVTAVSVSAQDLSEAGINIP